MAGRLRSETKVDIEPFFRFFRGFRRRRMRFFYRRFEIEPGTAVLDIGGREFNWSLMPFTPRVTILNVSIQGQRSDQFAAFGNFVPIRLIATGNILITVRLSKA